MLHEARLASYTCLLFEMEMYFTVEGMIRGYHVYKDVWNSNIGEMLPCTIEISNKYDPNAIAVMKGGTVVDHLARKISFISKLFLELEGSAIESSVLQIHGTRGLKLNVHGD